MDSKGAYLKQRVVITEISTINPFGFEKETITNKLLKGVSAANGIKVFDPAQLNTRFAAEAIVPNNLQMLRDRKISFALWCAEEILKKSDIIASVPSTKSCLSIGLGLELFSMEDMIYYLNFLNFLNSN